MSNRRVKSLAVDDDDFGDDDYEDQYDDNQEQELTDEDKEQMRQGTIKVREVLGSAFSAVTDKDIQDALWHYYYDVGKSVAYLKSRFTHSVPSFQISDFDISADQHKPTAPSVQKQTPVKKRKYILSSPR